MKKQIRGILTLISLFTLIITGCGAYKGYDISPMEESSGYEDVDDYTGEEIAVEEEIGFDAETTNRNKNQKLIYRGYITIELVEELDPIVKSMKTFVESHDGYIENLEQYEIGSDPISKEKLHSVMMKIRIPHKHYEKTFQTIEELGAVANKSSSVEDVTLQYSDIESTVKMYKVEQDRLLKMLEAETSDIKDMIEIERRLSQVRMELEKQESAKRALESQITYDTIELEMIQVRRESDITSAKTFANRIKATFSKSIDTVIQVSQALILVVTYLLIPTLIVGVIFAIIYTIIKRRKK